MNKLYTFLLSLTLTTLSVSCKKDTAILAPNPPDVSQPGGSANPLPTEQAGAVTPVGNPVGAVVTATIGPAGGRIESDDQRVRVEIPAGALTGNQTLSVQALDQNHCPGGTGTAFRLLPHGLTFAKPATITFNYDDDDVAGSVPAFLRVAYQTDKGFWESPEVSRLDTAGHSFSVKTSHFSDWTAFKNIQLTPESAVVDPGGSVELKLEQFVGAREGDWSKGTLPIPDVPQSLDQKYISRWELSTKEGVLTHQINKGTYYAPSSIPAKNPVTVSVFLNKTITIDGQVFRDLRVVSTILVAPEGMSIQIDGGSWKTYKGGIGLHSPTSIALGSNGDEKCGFAFPGFNPGSYRWTLGVGVNFNLHRGHILYNSVYEVNKKPVVSGGTLRVLSVTDDWVTGTLAVEPAGWIQPNNPYDPIGRATINGVFRLRCIKEQ